MKLTEVFIKRPIFAAMVIMALVVLGVFSFFNIGVDSYPQVDFPFVSVTTTLPGASPEEIETEITKRVEEEINTISGLDELLSYSYEGYSLVIAQFVLEKSGDIAAEEVRDRVSRVVSQFPSGTKSPVVQKFDISSQPIIQVAVTSQMPIRDLTKTVRKKIKEMLETVNGVGSIEVVGDREREIHVYIDPVKVDARGISITDVELALLKHNLEMPGGRITEEPREFTVRTMGKIQNAEDFGYIPITIQNGIPILIRDVAKVADVEQEKRTFSRLDGVPCVSLLIKKQSGANTVEVAQKIVARIDEIKKVLPSGIEVQIVQDQSRFVEASVHSLEEDVVLGAILVAFTVLLFLRSFRSMIICAVSIPSSLIATFTLMRWMGFTFNNLTLLALSLASGVVIDDAIIVLENIFRHIEELKEKPMEAASRAIAEIGMAVVSTTLSLMVIFIPLAMMSGIVGRFMFSFGMTMAFAIAVSLIFAFVLTPTMSARLLREKDVHKGDSSKDNLINRTLDKYYTHALKWALSNRKKSVIIAIVIMFSSVPSIIFVGKDFIPKDDKSEFNVHLKAPVGTSVNEMDYIVGKVEKDLKGLKGVQHILTTVGSGQNQAVNEADVYVQLVGVKERSFKQKDVMAWARNVLTAYPTIVPSVQDIGGPGGGHASFQARLTGPNVEKLKEYADKLMEKMRVQKGFADVDTTFEFGKPEIRVNINRQRAADLKVAVDDIARALQLFVSGEKDITKFKVDDELYEVRVRLAEEYRKRPYDLLNLTVPASIGNGEKHPVRLDQVATIEETTGPSQIERYMRQRTIEIGSNLVGIATGDGKKFVLEEAKKINMEPGYEVDFVGQAKFMGQMQKNFIMAFALSFIFMYMILASLFESLVHPITILASLPLAFPFAILSLLATGMTVHIISILGLFLLIGIVKKNAILQVDYTNTLRAKGLERSEALIQASRIRLRPIMMTTLTLVASMIPVALATGVGSASRVPMAVVIIGGQTMCLFVTLILTPVFYSVMDDMQNSIKARIQRLDLSKFKKFLKIKK